MILVTGGSGLVGSHLVIDLISKGERVRVISRQPSPPSYFPQLMTHYGQDPNLLESAMEWYQGDITDGTSIQDAFESVTHVYHCAALVSFNRRDYHKLMDINVTGTANVVNLAQAHQVEKFCHVSSTAAIGKKPSNFRLNDPEVVVEDGEWVRELSSTNYSKSKFLAEREVWRAREEGLPVVIVNPCVVLGPGDWDQSSSTIFKTAANGLKYFTKGSNAFVDVRDVVEVMRTLMDSEIEGERYLVIGENLDFKQVFSLLAKAFSKPDPHKEVRPWLSELGWRFEGVRSRLLGQEPRITKETARNAHNRVAYSNAKVTEALDYRFNSVKDAIDNASRFYLSTSG